jgi:hypothetical protein
MPKAELKHTAWSIEHDINSLYAVPLAEKMTPPEDSFHVAKVQRLVSKLRGRRYKEKLTIKRSMSSKFVSD